jgi:hypothetical protein
MRIYIYIYVLAPPAIERVEQAKKRIAAENQPCKPIGSVTFFAIAFA